ncbi:sporulation protein Cse60 [Paenibacillus sp. FSL F4-0097]|uniref:sporulation protein Cse60 n=1 Tax=Paenibacillus sp. FSL F4-0097 TaxID=2921369 RepID=UPI003158D023
MNKKIKLFENTSMMSLEDEVNEFLLEIEGSKVEDIKHSVVAVTLDDEALKLFTAIVVYQVEESGPRKTAQRESAY